MFLLFKMNINMWQTHITVAAVIEQNQKFLMVTDKISSGYKLNQPAGHLEANEDLLMAIQREVKEETSLDFTPQKIIGIYLFHPNPNHTYLRVCFKGVLADASIEVKPSPNDDGVVAAAWYSYQDLKNQAHNLRSSLVLRCIDDYLQGTELPLETVIDYPEYQIIEID